MRRFLSVPPVTFTPATRFLAGAGMEHAALDSHRHFVFARNALAGSSFPRFGL